MTTGGVIRRDLEPSNIEMLGDFGEVHVVDRGSTNRR